MKQKPSHAKKPAPKAVPGKQALLRKKYHRAILRNALIAVATVLILAVGVSYVYLRLAFKGPSPAFSNQLVSSLMETSAMKFVPALYFTDSQIDEILARNQVVSSDEETDLSLITVQARQPRPDQAENGGEDEGIEVVEISGSTYKGYLMIVSDPSRVMVGTCADSFTGASGLQLDKIAQRYHAVAAINGGAFSDVGGMGNGGTPLGLVISGGRLMCDSLSVEGQDILIGFDENDKLVIGKMTRDTAKQRGIRDAVTFGPALIVNGERSTVLGAGSGLNPRTAIGQRRDGAVLLLVIDGRQSSSLGATYKDLIDVMEEYGAVNAANLDGGSSSLMYYKGKYLNNGFVLIGSRAMPTGFIVK